MAAYLEWLHRQEEKHLKKDDPKRVMMEDVSKAAAQREQEAMGQLDGFDLMDDFEPEYSL